MCVCVCGKTEPALVVHVHVVDPRHEADAGWFERVILGELNTQEKNAAFVRRVAGPEERGVCCEFTYFKILGKSSFLEF